MKNMSDSEHNTKPKMKNIIGLVMLTSFVVCLFLASLWVIPYFGFKAIHPLAPWIAGFFIFLAILAVAWA